MKMQVKEETKIKSLLVRKSKFEGEVTISGAKNSALRLLAASLLSKETIELNNFPNGLLDVIVHVDMLKTLGKNVSQKGNKILITEEKEGLSSQLIWNGRSIRNTLLILGALVSRFGYGKVPLPGGCKLGERKYDLHVMLLEQLGARVWEEGDYLCAESNGRLFGGDIHLPIRSTGATENSIICGSLAIGKTTIWNPHIRPEILDLIDMINTMGGNIKVYGQKCIIVEGVESLHGVIHSVIPDNMEALTWAIGATMTHGEIEMKKFPYEHLEVPLIFLRESGMKFYRHEDSIIVKGGTPYPIEISTGPYPGINSDMQPLFAIYGASSKGNSKIVDLRFPGRYGYAEELEKLGLDYNVNEGLLHIKGGNKLLGNRVKAVDLRAGISLLLAGCIASGETIIEDAWQITRGYENIEQKLREMSINFEIV